MAKLTKLRIYDIAQRLLEEEQRMKESISAFEEKMARLYKEEKERLAEEFDERLSSLKKKYMREADREMLRVKRKFMAKIQEYKSEKGREYYLFARERVKEILPFLKI